jgi:predicted metal-dependent enzyme (double-stranded beta helix superfamily)
MDYQDWFVTEQGECESLDLIKRHVQLQHPYRLFRFLTDLEDLLEAANGDRQRLPLICALTRQLLNSSDWLQLACPPPDPHSGWSVQMLYDEPNFPLTVQLVSWLPGVASPVHNHACWGVVDLLSGQEKIHLWRRSPAPEHPDQIEYVGDQIVQPGEIISFLPESIHSVEALGDEPSISFNVYGITDYDQRFEFDPTSKTAKNF